MTIALQASSTVNASTGTMISHDVGDLLLWFAYNDGATVIPTVPAGWVTRFSQSLGTGSYVMAYKFAQTSSESYGTWTNADQIFASVWRGGPNTLVFPNYISGGAATATTVIYSAQTPGTFQTGASDQALIAWTQMRNVVNVLTSPSGMTLAQSATDGSVWQTRLDYQLNRTTIWPTTNVTVANLALYRTLVFGLVESPIYSVSSGGLILPLGFSGGMNE